MRRPGHVRRLQRPTVLPDRRPHDEAARLSTAGRPRRQADPRPAPAACRGAGAPRGAGHQRRAVGIAAQQEDVYAGGRSYFTEAPSGQSFGAEFDLAFRISDVDEPPALLLLLLAGLATVAWARRRPSRQTACTQGVSALLQKRPVPEWVRLAHLWPRCCRRPSLRRWR
jgi:hypothetical protein